jgi:hypothetical protein
VSRRLQLGDLEADAGVGVRADGRGSLRGDKLVGHLLNHVELLEIRRAELPVGEAGGGLQRDGDIGRPLPDFASFAVGRLFCGEG